MSGGREGQREGANQDKRPKEGQRVWVTAGIPGVTEDRVGVQSQFPVNPIKFHVLLRFSRPQALDFNKLLYATDQLS